MLAQEIIAAAGQAWPAFALVAGLLLIGAVVDAEGQFEAAGACFARAPLPPRGLLLVLLALVAGVTAVLNLDTSVVFLTPVLVHAARRRGFDERPFVYGSVFMANAASVLLPGSNLTNLLVLERDPIGGARFGETMLPAWVVACTLTAGFVALAFRLEHRDPDGGAAPTLRLGVGTASALVAAALVLVLRDPAPEVLLLGLAATAARRVRLRLDARVLGLLFALAVALGVLARAWAGPAQLLASSGRCTTAAIGAVASVLVNNLPAAVLLSAQAPPHPRALLLGLDLGPNLAVTGSLSAFLWLRSARSVGAEASLAVYSRLGALLVPLTLAGALAAPVRF